MRLHQPHQRRSAKGFSIIELMVSISIIALLIGISYPFLSALTSSSRVEAGLNVTGMASDVARQWVQAEAWANDGIPQPALESYSGTAAIYCPTGEIRIVINDRSAQDTGNVYIEDYTPETNAYKDLTQVDYILIPDGVGIAGVERFGNGANDIRFIAPPFAIAYNDLGQLYHGDANGYIYYDASKDTPTRYDTTAAGRRPGSYNPSEWTEDTADLAPDGVTKELPFDAIECVPGIVVYSAAEFDEAGYSFDGGGQIALGDPEGIWLKENGETVFFSPHTGVVLRDEQKD